MSLARAEKLYSTFHSHEPDHVGEFARGFRIPRDGFDVGDAEIMYYTSDKLNPTTGEDEGDVSYFHDHKEGVRMILTDDSRGGDPVSIPKKIWDTKALVLLGECDGFSYIDHDGVLREAKAKGQPPEWYCIPSGNALLVVQNKRDVLAIAWGGKLRVEWRGVVG